ncbi:hypothetical protein RJ640_018778 [Escallonia rubra]|uniref:Mechanosensitive ion channel protein n=1 Tax=Escallonia rubra TaxID=112253 RepID=A0AA88UTM8_9ASTE|nr:hypothetical protein RJ640_018778 [Escallonia rubra]
MTDCKRSSEVVVVIAGEEKKNAASKGGVNAPGSCPSPETARLGSSPNKPAKISTAEGLSQRKFMSRKGSLHSKSKSRFGEQSLPIDPNMFDDISSSKLEDLRETSNSPLRNTSNRSSPRNKVTSKEETPKTPLMTLSSQGVGAEDEEICKKVSIGKELKYKRVKMKVSMEWVVFLCIMGCLVASLRIEKLERSRLWGLEIWKWCVLIMVTFCGLFITNWIMHFVVLLIELNFLLRRKVLYFVHALKKSVQVFIWLAIVLVTWVLLFTNCKVKRSVIAHKILDYVTWTIASLLIGTFLWLLKTLLLKILASSFHVNTFFDRIQESIFHQYVLRTISGPPLLGRMNTASQLSVRQKQKKGKEKQVIDINKLHEMKREKVSAWTMKMLVDVISNSGLSTISNALEESDDGEGEEKDKEITSEMEAHAAAIDIFKNIVQPNCNDIDQKALRRFMLQEEVDLVLPLIDVAEKGRIDKTALIAWVVKVYKERKALAHTLNDTKTAVKQLNKLVSGILIIVIVIVWLLLMEIATKVLVLLSSQLLVAVFMFKNTCKTIFEAIVFVFVMHPFDVGDRCVIDGNQMIVEEMNILTTVFLKFDNEKIYYPNSVLATKPISNFYRSPEMGDSLEFSIDFMTPVEKIGTLKETIKKYLVENAHHWQPNHNVVVKEIENVNKIKMALFFNHTMNFQDFAEKMRRRSELVIEMKRIFHVLEIKYNLLPQDVNLVKQETTPTGSNT